MSEINSATLKAAVKELNELAVEGIEKIRTVGISVNKMAVLFIDACNAINEIDENLLSDNIVGVYNALPELADIPPEEEKEAKPAKAKKAPKAEKAPKVVVEKSRYGHVQSAKSGKLDDMLYEGATVQDMMDKLEVPRVRVIGHANHLKNDFGLTLLVKEDKENTLLTVLKVKEESYTPPAKTDKKAKAEAAE